MASSSALASAATTASSPGSERVMLNGFDAGAGPSPRIEGCRRGGLCRERGRRERGGDNQGNNGAEATCSHGRCVLVCIGQNYRRVLKYVTARGMDRTQLAT